MTTVLDAIVAQKRIDLLERMRRIPLDALRSRAWPRPALEESFAQAISGDGIRFILECKARSPSEGVLENHYQPGQIARNYKGLANAISVVTDGPFFGGDLAHLAEVANETSLPILCKDFVVDPYQVVEARAAGASAILLMLSILADETYRRCLVEVDGYGMDALTEVHDEAELHRAIALGARVIGINNRNLRTLQVDLETTRRLAPLIPSDRIVVCESGIQERKDWAAVAEWIDAVLVGTHLMKSPRIDLAARALVHGRVKICGLTTPQQVGWAHDAGATMGGVIFAPESPRRVDASDAGALCRGSPLEMVGVFVNEQPERVAKMARDNQLFAVQLHGDETAADVSSLRDLLPPGCEIWKGVAVRDRIPRIGEWKADRLVLDSGFDRQRGGTGRRFDWDMLVGHPDRSRFILAGGIRPENALAAMRLGCWAIDVNSGVESAPGIKALDAMRRLFGKLRGAA
jgi:indole-3-glycerol phosphate synthase/phosphoribosylanthranilate isomerase